MVQTGETQSSKGNIHQEKVRIISWNSSPPDLFLQKTGDPGVKVLF
jgi:hypothetical protein